MTAAIIAIMLILGGGTSYVAEGSIPGDFLYPVKIEVNENVKSTFAFSNEAEAKLQAQFVAERLEEAEKLALRGELNATVSAGIQNRLHTHYEEARLRSAEAQIKGKYEVSAVVRASLEGSFRIYEEILIDLNSRVSGNDCEPLITDLHTYAEATAEARAEAIVNIQTVVAAKVAKAATTATIEQTDDLIKLVQEKLPKIDGRVSLEAQTQIEAKLAEAVSTQTKAKTSLTAEAYRDAYTSSGEAMQAAHETAIMIDSLLRMQVVQESSIKSKVEVNNASGTDGVLDTELDSPTSTDSTFDGNLNTEVEGSTSASTTSEASVEIDATVDTDMVEENSSTTAAVQSELNL